MKEEKAYTGGLESMPLEELRLLLDELKADEERILQLEKDNPEIAKLESNEELNVHDYTIYQSLSTLIAIQNRIKNVQKFLK